MWLTDGFLNTFFGRWRGAVHIHMSHMQLMCGINMHGYYYYMVEGSPHMWLTCGSCVAINVHSNYYYMLEGSPHVWLMCGD